MIVVGINKVLFSISRLAASSTGFQVGRYHKIETVTHSYLIDNIGGLANGKSLKPSYIPFNQRVHVNVYTCVQVVVFFHTNTIEI